jgi:hypothetical protein
MLKAIINIANRALQMVVADPFGAMHSDLRWRLRKRRRKGSGLIATSSRHRWYCYADLPIKQQCAAAGLLTCLSSYIYY